MCETRFQRVGETRVSKIVFEKLLQNYKGNLTPNNFMGWCSFYDWNLGEKGKEKTTDNCLVGRIDYNFSETYYIMNDILSLYKDKLGVLECF